MNPRIQVEHTVTEEVTARRPRAVADAASRPARPSPTSSSPRTPSQPRGFALQCRITTEDPANGFRPDTGKITTYRSPGGPGVRLDGGTTYTGAEISPHFDSMLAKLTCRGRTFEAAVQKARRALLEFRIRGVSTNVGFLQAVLADPDFAAGGVTTSFIEDHPQLLKRAVRRRPRHHACSTYLADVTVNQPHGTAPVSVVAGQQAAPARPLAAGARRHPPAAARDRPGGVRPPAARAGPVAVTDTTFRDAHQSLLATRVRTRDLLAVADHVARTTPQLWSVECWGGATYDVALRFLDEDPWERLAALREAIPNIGLQMLLRGRNTVGYTPYPTEVTEAFVQEAAETGIDVFRVFDALNDVSQMRPAIDAVRATGTSVAEVALCYTGDLSSPGEKLYTLDYYLRLAEQIVDAGAHVLAIKDMAGLLRAPAARTLVTALRERFDLPVHLHTHDTPGGQLATLLAAIDAGVDAVDAACASMAGTHLAARALRAGLRDRPLRARDRALARRGQRDGALLGGRPPRLRTVRVGPARAHRSGLPPRDPRRPALQPAPAGDRARPRREVRAGRGHVRRGQRHPRQRREGDPVVQGRRRPRARARRGRRRPGASSRRTRRRTTSRTR